MFPRKKRREKREASRGKRERDKSLEKREELLYLWKRVEVSIIGIERAICLWLRL